MKYIIRTKKDLIVWNVSRNISHTQIQITYQHSVDNTEYVYRVRKHSRV